MIYSWPIKLLLLSYHHISLCISIVCINYNQIYTIYEEVWLLPVRATHRLWTDLRFPRSMLYFSSISAFWISQKHPATGRRDSCHNSYVAPSGSTFCGVCGPSLLICTHTKEKKRENTRFSRFQTFNFVAATGSSETSSYYTSILLCILIKRAPLKFLFYYNS